MPLILLNKPYQVMCQFSAHPSRQTLADFLPVSGVYPAGRLDADSEGLVLLTDDGRLQYDISHPQRKEPKTYIVQVEGVPDVSTLMRLRSPMNLGDSLQSVARRAGFKSRIGFGRAILRSVGVPARQPVGWQSL